MDNPSSQQENQKSHPVTQQHHEHGGSIDLSNDSPPSNAEPLPTPDLLSREEDDDQLTDKLYRDMHSDDRLLELHPYTRILTLHDLESCLILEDVSFPPSQRCSREKFVYRLTKASPLCFGLFTSIDPDSEYAHLPTFTTSETAETGSDRRAVLLAHVVVTLTTNDTVLDSDMALPSDWNSPIPTADPSAGHKPEGRTIALHSFAVLPTLRGRGLGGTLLRGWIQMMRASKIADSIALLTYERLIPLYEKFGFTCMGKSDATYGGEQWYDLVLDFEEDSEESF